MKIKKIKSIWIGPRRKVPRYGIFEKGDQITLPSSIFKEFEKRKLVKRSK